MADKAELWRGGAKTELAEVGLAEAELVGVGAGGGEAVAGRSWELAGAELWRSRSWRRRRCGGGGAGGWMEAIVGSTVRSWQMVHKIYK